MRLSGYATKIGISYNTDWRMWKRGQIPGYQLSSGTVIIDLPELRSTHVRNPKTGHIVVEHKDRAIRFGVAYIQTLLALQGRDRNR